MKKILAAGLVLVALAACKKEPTLGDRLEGSWLVNDIVATGQLVFGGQNIPLVANDKDIAATSVFTLIQEPNSVDYAVDATLSVSAGTTLDVPWAQSGSGTWTVLDGAGVAPDSVHLLGTDGSVTKYEVLSLLETSVRLRTQQVVDFQGQGIDMTIEFGFAKQ
ncbi:MAG TPA: hypothetical protein DCE13_01105 [Cryomorphaceae bacterium]|jgi:hypothetical protein|nr:MAG: hypothetical protein ABR98_07705 [Cryomorphaceae bacterium BACL7 MAG-120910-bin2]KRO68699.1 MAG: hypothetical protein ABR88_07560 [Cryomorphaceae bacterium BACL7 MAG-120322-bin74]KRO81856.1 MAG: hypothetical protein ABR87_02265 [Cryomorphaceae bacterium BACL7 MAG-121220-bin83]NQW25836.1 hypothetical protein [Cryomorphaceae bacterium]HAB31119.1 hypothetical protein [Cryomorphaceae bacterium]|tara:strand:- start:43 stop:531 length:489 start_codon:yes stop_codon:yes gene_type:complete